MKATMESTSKLITLNGLQLRVWEGTSEHGVQFVALVNQCAALSDVAQNQLIKELMQTKEPAPGAKPAFVRLGIEA